MLQCEWNKTDFTIVPQFFLHLLLSPSFPPSFFPSIFCLHSAEHPKLPSAVRAGVNSILHAIDAKRNKATSSPAANQDEPSTSEPGQSAGGIHHWRDYSCSAVRTDHGYGGFSIHSIPHNNSLGLRDDRCSLTCLLMLWRWIALLRWCIALLRRITWLLWIARLLWIASLLWVRGLPNWRIACRRLIWWWFIRHDEFFDRLQQLSKVLLHEVWKEPLVVHKIQVNSKDRLNLLNCSIHC